MNETLRDRDEELAKRRTARRNDNLASQPDSDPRGPGSVGLQRALGNAAVGRLIQARQEASAEGLTPLTPALQQEIDAESAGGRPLDSDVRTEMEASLSADFPGVRVHTGPPAERLASQMDAVAFTRGRDVFFGAGAYNAASARGKETLAHELTHVAQERTAAGAVQLQEAPKPAEATDPAVAAAAAAAAAKPVETYTLKDASVVVPSTIEAKVKEMAEAYYKSKTQALVLTDGERSAANQATAMLNKLKSDGEAKVKNLYKATALTQEVVDAWKSKTSEAEQLTAMTDAIQKQIDAGKYISNHLQNKSVDVRSGGIDKAELEKAVTAAGGTLLDETDTKAPHYHLTF